MTDLYCGLCKKHMATLHDAKVRNGMVVYCVFCNAILRGTAAGRAKPADMPEAFKKIFGGE